MRKIFRKVSAIAASALMVGMSMGVAAAANFPSGFSAADTAIVHGTGSGVSSLDQVQAGNIQTFLGTSGSVTLGSESYQIKGTGNEFNLGDAASAVRSTLRKEQLPVFLGDGTYLDEDGEEFDYTQKIDLSSNLVLSHFRDSDFDNMPKLGIRLSTSGTEVLNYTLSFQTYPDFTAAKLESTTIELLGSEYYVLDATPGAAGSNSLTLLDAASSTSIAEGASTTVTVGGQTYTVTADILSTSGTTNRATLTVNGNQFTVNEAGSRKIPGAEAYIGVKRVVVPSYAGQSSLVEFAIGSGKLVLTENIEAELNEKTVEGLYVGLMNTTGKLTGIPLQWKTDDKSFVTSDSELTLPGFGNIKLSMTDFYKPGEEVLTVQDSGSYIELNVPLKGGDVNLPLLWLDGTTNTINGTGESADKLLITSNATHLLFNKTLKHEYFVASWAGATDAYSEVFRITSVNAENETTLVAMGSGQTYSNVVDGGSVVAGDIELTLDAIRTDGSNWAVNLSGNSQISFRNLYTAEGLKIYLPYEVNGAYAAGEKGLFNTNVSAGNSTAGYNKTSWYLFLDEATKDGQIGSGISFNITLAPTGATDDEVIHVSGVDPNGLRIGTTDEYESYVVSDLASKIEWDKSGDEYTAAITYHGDESYGKVFVSSTDVSMSDDTAVGAVLVTDAEVSTVSSKNLIVVGGSCINSVAANLLGGYACGTDFTDKTGVGSGQFLIQSLASPYASGKIALVVAGYSADDTVNAATYLINQPKPVDTATGKKYVGTSSTSAELEVA